MKGTIKSLKTNNNLPKRIRKLKRFLQVAVIQVQHPLKKNPLKRRPRSLKNPQRNPQKLKRSQTQNQKNSLNKNLIRRKIQSLLKKLISQQSQRKSLKKRSRKRKSQVPQAAAHLLLHPPQMKSLQSKRSLRKGKSKKRTYMNHLI